MQLQEGKRGEKQQGGEGEGTQTEQSSADQQALWSSRGGQAANVFPFLGCGLRHQSGGGVGEVGL